MHEAGRESRVTEPKSCLTSKEVEPAMTWQLILAVQQANAVLAHISQQLTMARSGSEVSSDKCSDEFKVLANQYKQ